MTLDEYMGDRKISDTAMAALVGVSQPYIWRIRRGERRPSILVAFRIEEATKGAVKAASFVMADAA